MNADTHRRALLEDTLPFWLPRAIDLQHGGYLTSLDRNGSLIDRDKAIWQQGRFVWLLSKLFNSLDAREEWLDAARSGVRFLEQFGTDPADGRMWFLVSREGSPLRKRRYSFSEAFASIAFGEYARATGEQKYADLASAKFDAFVAQNLNPVGVPKWTSLRPTQSLGFPMIALNCAQELRESIRFPEAEEWIDRCLVRIRDHFVNEQYRCVLETAGPQGEVLDTFDGRTLNPGHAIEAAWFVMREGEHRGDRDLISLGATMLDWSWERGWDDQFGGLFYFTSIDDRPIQEYWHDMKFWWPHCEAMIATAMAWRLTRDEKYARRHHHVSDWAYDHFADPEFGEWFGYLNRDGSVNSRIKGNWWKGPFHLPRMQMLLSSDESCPRG